MFTGLIEAVGEVAAVTDTGSGIRLRVSTPLARELTEGESVSVNGVCLTMTKLSGSAFEADIGPETARITTLGRLQAGNRVNLERAMRADSRLGGHFVQGHVDGIGRVEDVRADGDAHWLTVSFPAALAPFFVAKGSVAVDGISLTVAVLDANQFDVMIIPFTWAHTALSSVRAGGAVNVECDMIGKYVARAVKVFGTV
jgi:riboflavin synthase